MAENIAAFAAKLGGEVGFTRLAVTPEHITSLYLPTAPAKPGDNRAFRGETCQAESIAPDVLAAILREVIENRLDRSAYDSVLQQETEERDRLVRLIAAGLPGRGAS